MSAAKTPTPKQKKQKPAVHSQPEHEYSKVALRAQGKQFRDKAPLKELGAFDKGAKHRDPIELLQHSNKGRISELIPIRHTRMSVSPFTFFRGAAMIMAKDLGDGLNSGIKVQSCGDCHILNFGAFATPERNIVVDINDFDETLRAPFEWDLKRLATSLILAADSIEMRASEGKQLAYAMTQEYRQQMKTFAEQTALAVWYSRFDFQSFIDEGLNKEIRESRRKALSEAFRKSSPETLVDKLTEMHDGQLRFRDLPPLLYHHHDFSALEPAREAFKCYRESLSPERRLLLNQFHLADMAIKVVGIGSVGTLCAVMLMLGSENDVLILQAKEARASVLEPYAGNSPYANHGERVVIGQKVMQAATDIFLGWTMGERGRHFYIRQLRDVKLSAMPQHWTKGILAQQAGSLGRIVARAHARSGTSPMISGYLGKTDAFESSIASYAVAYARQSERDYELFKRACKSGRLKTEATLR